MPLFPCQLSCAGDAQYLAYPKCSSVLFPVPELTCGDAHHLYNYWLLMFLLILSNKIIIKMEFAKGDDEAQAQRYPEP